MRPAHAALAQLPCDKFLKRHITQRHEAETGQLIDVHALVPKGTKVNTHTQEVMTQAQGGSPSFFCVVSMAWGMVMAQAVKTLEKASKQILITPRCMECTGVSHVIMEDKSGRAHTALVTKKTNKQHTHGCATQ